MDNLSPGSCGKVVDNFRVRGRSCCHRATGHPARTGATGHRSHRPPPAPDGPGRPRPPVPRPYGPGPLPDGPTARPRPGHGRTAATVRTRPRTAATGHRPGHRPPWHRRTVAPATGHRATRPRPRTKSGARSPENGHGPATRATGRPGRTGPGPTVPDSDRPPGRTLPRWRRAARRPRQLRWPPPWHASR